MSVTPLWSIMIPTYNAGHYLAETLNSVLQQAYDASIMEIVVVDNRSTDNTEDIVSQVGKGRIEFRVNPSNVGMMQNFNECVKQAKGQLLHILHADDLVNDGFYDEFTKAFNNNSDVYLVSCNAHVIDENGIESNVTEPILSLIKSSNNVDELLTTNPFRTPAVVVRREAYGKVGLFDVTLTHTADWDMWVRVVHQLKGLHLNQALCSYREHSANGTSKANVTGMNITDTEKLYTKFAQQGYPVDKEKQKDFLLHIVKYQFNNFYHTQNRLGVRNMLRLYIRMAGVLAAAKLYLKASVSR